MRGASVVGTLVLGLAGLLPAAVVANGGDSCAAPTAITALPFADGGTTIGAIHGGFTLPTGCSDYATVAGPDVVYSLTLGAGNSLTFQVVPEAGYDAAIYLLGTCDNANSCSEGADAGLIGAPEQLTVSGLTAGDYYFYVDSYYASGSLANPSRHQGAFTLDVTGSLGAVPTTTSTSLPTSSTSTTVATTTTTTTVTTTSTTLLVTSTSTTVPSTTTSTSVPSTTTSTTAPSTTTTSTTLSPTTTSTTLPPTTTTTIPPSTSTTSLPPSTTSTTVPSTTSTSLVPSTTSSTLASSTTSSSLLPSTTTSTTSSTTTTTPPPLCNGGAPITGGSIKLSKIDDPGGNEGLLVRGALDFPLGTPATFAPATRGAQLRVEDLGGAVILLDLTTDTEPISGGGPGTGCGPKDGWKKTTYRNKSGALGAPACPGGSAQGLKLFILKDKRARGRGIAFKSVVRRRTLEVPTGPLRVTLVLAAEQAAGAAGECGVATFPVGGCTRTKRTYACK